MTSAGELSGRPSEALVQSCDGSARRGRISFRCAACGVLPLSKVLVMRGFAVVIWDNICLASDNAVADALSRRFEGAKLPPACHGAIEDTPVFRVNRFVGRTYASF